MKTTGLKLETNVVYYTIKINLRDICKNIFKTCKCKPVNTTETKQVQK